MVETNQRIRSEIITHWQLRHNNILQLLGVYQEAHDAPPFMVVPYMENKSSSIFLQTYGDAETYIHVVSNKAVLFCFDTPSMLCCTDYWRSQWTSLSPFKEPSRDSW